MHNAQLGLVLKRFYPRKQALSVLFANHGKQTIIADPLPMGQRLWPGTIIACSLDGLDKPVVFARDIELLAVPLQQDLQSISWLHQMLELCYYLLPPSAPAEEVFSMLYRSFSLFSKTRLPKQDVHALRQLCRGKLLTLLDFHPEPWLKPGLELFTQCLRESVDFKVPPAVDWQQQIQPWTLVDRLARLDAWIMHCLQCHPQGRLVRAHAGASSQMRKEKDGTTPRQ